MNNFNVLNYLLKWHQGLVQRILGYLIAPWPQGLGVIHDTLTYKNKLNTSKQHHEIVWPILSTSTRWMNSGKKVQAFVPGRQSRFRCERWERVMKVTNPRREFGSIDWRKPLDQMWPKIDKLRPIHLFPNKYRILIIVHCRGQACWVASKYCEQGIRCSMIST